MLIYIYIYILLQYPILRIAQSTLHFTSLFIQTPSQLLWEASSHTLQLMHEGCSYTYPPFVFSQVLIYMSELEQCRVKKLARGFNTAAQDSNPGPRSRESKVLPRATALYYDNIFYLVYIYNYIYIHFTTLFFLYDIVYNFKRIYIYVYSVKKN